MEQNSRTPRTNAGVYAAAAAFLQSVPIPFVDTHLAGTARSSVFRRIARAHGLRLDRETRPILVRLPSADRLGIRRRVALRAGRTLIQRFLIPARLFMRLETAARTLVEAHLFELYLSERSDERPHINALEASHLRTALDEAVREGLPELLGALAGSLAKIGERGQALDEDEERDLLERGIDALLGTLADLPDDLLLPFETRFRAHLANRREGSEG